MDIDETDQFKELLEPLQRFAHEAMHASRNTAGSEQGAIDSYWSGFNTALDLVEAALEGRLRTRRLRKLMTEPSVLEQAKEQA